MGIRRDAQDRQLQGHQLALELGDPGGQQRVVEQRAVPGRNRPRARLGVGQATLDPPDRSDTDALVAEQELGIVPAAVLFPDKLVRRDAHIVEEDLVDLVVAVDELDRPRRGPGRSSRCVGSIEMPC